MALNTQIIRVAGITLMIAFLGGAAVAQTIPSPNSPPLSAHPLVGTPLSIELQGGPFTPKFYCIYGDYTGGRDPRRLDISWGDGTVSTLNSGPEGESCDDIGQHTYAKPGTYPIRVDIGGLGYADEPVSWSGITQVMVAE